MTASLYSNRDSRQIARLSRDLGAAKGSTWQVGPPRVCQRVRDEGLVIRLYGGDVLVEEPAELRDAIVAQLRRALDAYEDAARIALEAVAAGFRNDDSRVRSTRGRTPTET